VDRRAGAAAVRGLRQILVASPASGGRGPDQQWAFTLRLAQAQQAAK
jgi:hypothetical protein